MALLLVVLSGCTVDQLIGTSGTSSPDGLQLRIGGSAATLSDGEDSSGGTAAWTGAGGMPVVVGSGASANEDRGTGAIAGGGLLLSDDGDSFYPGGAGGERPAP